MWWIFFLSVAHAVVTCELAADRVELSDQFYRTIGPRFDSLVQSQCTDTGEFGTILSNIEPIGVYINISMLDDMLNTVIMMEQLADQFDAVAEIAVLPMSLCESRECRTPPFKDIIYDVDGFYCYTDRGDCDDGYVCNDHGNCILE